MTSCQGRLGLVRQGFSLRRSHLVEKAGHDGYNHKRKEKMGSTSKLHWLSSAILTFVFLLISYSASVSTKRTDGLRTRDENAKRVDNQELFLSNNLTDQVQWDQYSLIVKGQRILL